MQPTSTHEENLVRARGTQLFKGEYSGGDVPHEPVNPSHQILPGDGAAGQDVPVVGLEAVQVQNLQSEESYYSFKPDMQSSKSTVNLDYQPCLS